MADRGVCKTCGNNDRLLDDEGRCYLECVEHSDEEVARCPKCGTYFDYEICDYEGESERDVECPECEHEFRVEIDIEYRFYLSSPKRIVENDNTNNRV